jgi:small subunit ribosomal protein S8e
MKRKFELGRQPAMTKVGERRVHQVRCRGGYIKFRALKVDHGNYAWPGEAVTRKARILTVVYNPTNPEYVRTNTVVKGSIVQIDANPFKNWYQKHYGVVIGKAVPFAKVCFDTNFSFCILSLEIFVYSFKVSTRSYKLGTKER